MNRLAQAFVCLTEAGAKRAYDERLLGERRPIAPPPVRVPPPPVRVPPPVMAVVEAPAGPRDALVWLYTPGTTGPGDTPPPPPRVRGSSPPPPPPPVTEGELVTEPLEAPAAPPDLPPPDPIVVAATSPQARRGLSSRQALAEREKHARELLQLWQRLEKYLA